MIDIVGVMGGMKLFEFPRPYFLGLIGSRRLFVCFHPICCMGWLFGFTKYGD